MAIWRKLTVDHEVSLGLEYAETCAAAALNRLFVCDDHQMHNDIPHATTDSLVEILVRGTDDEDIPYAIIMTLRTLAAINIASKDFEKVERVLDREQIVKESIMFRPSTSFPSDAPNPQIMEELATRLNAKYPKYLV